MDCRTVHDHLSTYLDHDLPLQTRVLLDQHFDACPPCRTALTQLRTVALWVRDLPQIEPSSTFLHRVCERVEGLPQQSRTTFFRRLAGTIPLQAAAALVVVVSAALIWQIAPYGWQENQVETELPYRTEPRMSRERNVTPVLDAPPFEPMLEESFPSPAPVVQAPLRHPSLMGREQFVRYGRDWPTMPLSAGMPGMGRGGEVSFFPSLILRTEDPVQTAQQIWELVPRTGGALLQSQGMITPAGHTIQGPVRMTLAIAADRYHTLLDTIRQIPGTLVTEERMAIIGREMPLVGTASLRQIEQAQTTNIPSMTLVITVFPR